MCNSKRESLDQGIQAVARAGAPQVRTISIKTIRFNQISSSSNLGNHVRLASSSWSYLCYQEIYSTNKMLHIYEVT
jgi:hypothetical protein